MKFLELLLPARNSADLTTTPGTVTSGSAGRLALGMAGLFGLILFTYLPILPGHFIWDDRLVLHDLNPLINGELTPWSIWFQTDFVLTNFGFWAEWRAWGEHPLGYHLVNLALHGLSATLLWRLLARLHIPGAWLAAALFAVHPVAVNSVARIAELKNTLSLVWMLVAFYAYLRAEAARAPSGGRLGMGWQGGFAGWYFAALAAFLLALFSKTSILSLPVLLLLGAYWQRGRLTRLDLLHSAPFFVLALAFGLLSSWFQRYQALAGETLPLFTFMDRLAVAGHDIWVYWGKAWWPVRLCAVYPWWTPAEHGAWAWLPLALAAGVLLAALVARQSWGRHVLFGFGAFVAALFPALGFFDAQFLTWFQVSDHLQYLPLLAAIGLGTGALAAGLGRWFAPVGAGLLVLVAVLGHHRAQIFATDATLWQDTLAKNPGAWMARNNLGTMLAAQHRLAEAGAQFAASLQLKPQNPDALMNLGQVRLLEGDFATAREHFLALVRAKPLNPQAHANLAQALAQLGATRSAIMQYKVALQLDAQAATRLRLASLLHQTGDYPAAVGEYHRLTAQAPAWPEPFNNLAWLLATCPDPGVRNGAEAVACAEQACTLTHYQQAGMVGTLAAAYAEAGRFPDAVRTCEQTIQLAEAQGNANFSALNQQLLRWYRAGRAYHAPKG